MNTLPGKSVNAADAESAFDKREASGHVDHKSVKTHDATQRIGVDFPKDVLRALDIESAKRGVTRASLITRWVTEALSKQRYEHVSKEQVYNWC